MSNKRLAFGRIFSIAQLACEQGHRCALGSAAVRFTGAAVGFTGRGHRHTSDRVTLLHYIQISQVSLTSTF